jgi:hypothetical protein
MKKYFLIILLAIQSCSEPTLHRNLMGYWDEPPRIEICDDLLTDVDFVIDQLDWWHEEVSKNYNYSKIVYSNCNQKN